MHHQLIAILILLLVGWPLRAQRLIEASAPGADAWDYIANILPAPVFHHSFNNNGGTGTTATADTGADCPSMSNITWVEDPASSGHHAIDLNGSTSAINCGTALDGLMSTAGFTVSIWMQGDTYGASGAPVLLAKFGSNANQRSWGLRLNDDTDRYTFQFGDTTATQVFDVYSTGTDSVDACMGTATWCHVVAVVTGPCTGMACTSVQIYVNGSPVTTTLTTDSSGTLRSDSADSVRIGSFSAIGSNILDGRVDEPAVFPVPFSAAQVAALFAQGRP